MRPKEDIRQALAMLAWLNSRANPGEERHCLEYAEQVLRWVMGQKSALDDVLVTIANLKRVVGPPSAATGTPRPKNPPPAGSRAPLPQSASGGRAAGGRCSRT